MFAKHLQIIYIVQICFGTISILFITKACTEHLRHKAGIWAYDPQPFYMYGQFGNNYLNAYRKLYWYASRHPTLPPRKQRVSKLLMPHAYRNVPRENVLAPQGNQLRNIFKPSNEVALTPKLLGAYLTTAKIFTTAIPKTTASPILRYPITEYKNHTICVHKRENIFPIEKTKSIVNITQPMTNFMELKSTPIIRQSYPPFQPFVAHTYFTLDDVIDPYTPENLTYRSVEENSDRREQKNSIRAENEIARNLISAESKIVSNVTNATMRIAQKEISYPFEPITSSAAPLKTTTAAEPDPTTLPPTEADFAEDPFTIAPPKATKSNLSNEIEVENKHVMPIINLFPRKLLRFDKLHHQTCEECKKIETTTTQTSPTNATQTEAIEEANPSKISTLTLRKDYGRKYTISSTNLTHIQRKSHPKFGKNLSMVKLTTTTEAPMFRSRRNKTRFINLRRRKLTANTHSHILKQANSTSATPPKHENDLPKNQTSRPIIELPKNQTSRPIIDHIRNQTQAAANLTVTTTPSPRVVSEVTALAAESAIMTISKTNGRKVKRLQSRYQKPITNNTKIASHTDFARKTDVPKLPIEVYFTKLNPK